MLCRTRGWWQGCTLTPNIVDLITKSLSHKSDIFFFCLWLLFVFYHGFVVPSASHSQCVQSLLGKSEHITARHTRYIWLLHTSTELANVHAGCMKENTVFCSLCRQMTVEFLWKTKIHCSGGVEDVRLRGVTTWTPAVLAWHPKVRERDSTTLLENQREDIWRRLPTTCYSTFIK